MLSITFSLCCLYDGRLLVKIADVCRLIFQAIIFFYAAWLAVSGGEVCHGMYGYQLTSVRRCDCVSEV